MALVSSHYFHTAYEQAEQVLSTCEQLAAGLGAPPDKVAPSDVLTFGNIQLGLWVSERSLGLWLDPSLPHSVTNHTIEDLYIRSGKMDMLEKQRKKVERLRDALSSLQDSHLPSSFAGV